MKIELDMFNFHGALSLWQKSQQAKKVSGTFFSLRATR